jgi:hypothetical protein
LGLLQPWRQSRRTRHPDGTGVGVDPIRQMAEGTLDLDRVIGVPVRYLGPGDERINRLRSIG